MSVSPTAVSDELAPGTPVGEYRVVEKVGEGGFGSVYLARHPVIGKDAAVKVLSLAHSRREDHVSRFMAEARAVNQIGHPNIVDIFSFGRLDSDGRLYFVMEYIEGETLEARVRRRDGLPPAEAMPILRAVARALQAAHDQDILHRDLKPANVLVAESDGEPLVKLIDFGIAKLLDQDVQHKTRTGTPIGTPQTMSPEQCLSRALDVRSDIYSFGILCFFTLTGRMPFVGDSQMDLMMMHMSEAPPAPSSVEPRLGAAVDGAVLSMLEKEPASRPASVIDALAALAQAVEHPGATIPHTPSATLSSPPAPRAEAAPPSTGGAIPKAPSPPLRKVALVGSALALGALATVLWRGESPPPRAEAVLPPSTPAPAPSTITLRFRSEPPKAEVWRGDQQLGTTDGPLVLPRSDEPVRLSFRARGWIPLDRELSLRADQLVEVRLSPLVAPETPSPSTRYPSPPTPPAPSVAPPPHPVGGSRDELAF